MSSILRRAKTPPRNIDSNVFNKAGESQGRAPGQASDYTLLAPNHLDGSTHYLTFYQDFGPPNQSGPQVLCPPLPPLSPALVFKALIALRKDLDRVVLSAEKGNCVVVMDKHQYREKVFSMLNDKQTYTVLKSDPTGRTERDLNQRLLLLKKSNKGPVINYRGGGAGGNEKLDVKILLAPPLRQHNYT